MSGTSLGTLVTYNPWTVGPTALIDDVAARFHELGVHHVVVVDEQRGVVGILSETDILRAKQSRRAALVGVRGREAEDSSPVFVRSAMSRDVISIPSSATAADALALLLRRGIHALPVIAERQLVGLITSRDVLRELSYGERPCSRQPVSALMLPHLPEPLGPNTSLDQALLAMHDAGVSCLGISQGGCPIGFLSQRDIVRAKCRLEDGVTSASDTAVIPTVMPLARKTPPLRTTQRLCEAASIMLEHNLSAVMVVSQANKLIGLVTEDDLVQVMYDEEA